VSQQKQYSFVVPKGVFYETLNKEICNLTKQKTINHAIVKKVDKWLQNRKVKWNCMTQITLIHEQILENLKLVKHPQLK